MNFAFSYLSISIFNKMQILPKRKIIIYEFFSDSSKHKCYLKGHGNLCFNQLNYKALNPIAISGYLCSNKNGTKCWSTTGQIHESCYYELLNKVVLETSEDLSAKVSEMGYTYLETDNKKRQSHIFFNSIQSIFF